jgi:hypothetical protein
MQEMGAEAQRWPYLLVLNWRAGGTHVVTDNGSGWLRWLLRQEGVILAHQNRDNRCALGLPLIDRVILHPSKEPRSKPLYVFLFL